MLDTLQLYFALIIFVITVMISVILVQVYFIIEKFRGSLGKFKNVTDNSK